ncbi:MAG: SDR family oxidoreductase [Chloroflexi bacterium]|nr:SDR family oxidoreductase [Chloroflexota bacterium]
MTERLKGKVALITGGGSGMGRATAILFAREGARVAVADYVAAGATETVEMIQDSGSYAVFIQADVSKAADAKRMVESTVSAYGRLDILHNNAGVGHKWVPMADIAEEEYDRVLGTNLNYCAAKGGVVLLTKSMALEYARQNIRVNCICPGFIRTGMSQPLFDHAAALERTLQRQPMGKAGEPEDIARAALYLACDDSRFVTGTCLVVDGGVSATSGFTDPAEYNAPRPAAA